MYDKMISGICILLCAFLIWLCIILNAFAYVTIEEGICDDPSYLTQEQRGAYYQLKELSKEIEGMDVSINCRKTTIIEDKEKVVIREEKN